MSTRDPEVKEAITGLARAIAEEVARLLLDMPKETDTVRYEVNRYPALEQTVFNIKFNFGTNSEVTLYYTKPYRAKPGPEVKNDG